MGFALVALALTIVLPSLLALPEKRIGSPMSLLARALAVNPNSKVKAVLRLDFGDFTLRIKSELDSPLEYDNLTPSQIVLRLMKGENCEFASKENPSEFAPKENPSAKEV